MASRAACFVSLLPPKYDMIPDIMVLDGVRKKKKAKEMVVVYSYAAQCGKPLEASNWQALLSEYGNSPLT